MVDKTVKVAWWAAKQPSTAGVARMGNLRKRALACLSVALALLPAAPAQEVMPPPAPARESTELSLADLEQLALQHNPTLKQAGAQVEASRGRAVQSGLYPNPTIGYDGEQI